MQVSCTPDAEVPGATLVKVAGRLDAVGATELWDRASPHITAEAPSLLVDLTGVDLMSSAGITTMIQFLQRSKPLGGSLGIFGCNPSVRKVFRIVGLEAMLNVCDDAGEARRRATARPRA